MLKLLLSTYPQIISENISDVKPLLKTFLQHAQKLAAWNGKKISLLRRDIIFFPDFHAFAPWKENN
jgi:hypothetical protein